MKKTFIKLFILGSLFFSIFSSSFAMQGGNWPSKDEQSNPPKKDEKPVRSQDDKTESIEELDDVEKDDQPSSSRSMPTLSSNSFSSGIPLGSNVAAVGGSAYALTPSSGVNVGLPQDYRDNQRAKHEKSVREKCLETERAQQTSSPSSSSFSSGSSSLSLAVLPPPQPASSSSSSSSSSGSSSLLLSLPDGLLLIILKFVVDDPDFCTGVKDLLSASSTCKSLCNLGPDSSLSIGHLNVGISADEARLLVEQVKDFFEYFEAHKNLFMECGITKRAANSFCLNVSKLKTFEKYEDIENLLKTHKFYVLLGRLCSYILIIIKTSFRGISLSDPSAFPMDIPIAFYNKCIKKCYSILSNQLKESAVETSSRVVGAVARHTGNKLLEVFRKKILRIILCGGCLLLAWYFY